MNGIAPDWLCLVSALYVFILLPLDAWLIALPSSIRERNRRTRQITHISQDHPLD